MNSLSYDSPVAPPRHVGRLCLALVSQPVFRERVHRSSRPVREGSEKRGTRVVSAGPSNATALIKIDDGEIALGQFDECRYPLNYEFEDRAARRLARRVSYFYGRSNVSSPRGALLFV